MHAIHPLAPAHAGAFAVVLAAGLRLKRVISTAVEMYRLR
jgi:hypothetical protein